MCVCRSALFCPSSSWPLLLQPDQPRPAQAFCLLTGSKVTSLNVNWPQFNGGELPFCSARQTFTPKLVENGGSPCVLTAWFKMDFRHCGCGQRHVLKPQVTNKYKVAAADCSGYDGGGFIIYTHTHTPVDHSKTNITSVNIPLPLPPVQKEAWLVGRSQT